jgi:hypothetical protein
MDLQPLLLWIPAINLLLFSYGAITLYGRPFQATSDQGVRLSTGPKPHIPSGFHQKVRFVLFPFQSPLLRESLLLSSPAPTRMFRFRASPMAKSHRQTSGSPIRKSQVQRLLAPTLGLSQLATSFIGFRAEPSTT